MLRMVLQYKNPDSSSDINLRFKDVFGKGFTNGAGVTPSGVALTVDVAPFVLVNFDGAVVTSDAIETLTVIDNQINYVVCRSRYRNQDTPILSMEVLSDTAYAADPELSWLHVVAVVDLVVGSPNAFVPASAVSYDLRDEIDPQGRDFWRDPVATVGSLPTVSNRNGDTRLVIDTGSLYWWKTAASAWQLFDEVPLQIHRDREHVNGVTGDSAATTLQPGVNLLNMTVEAVPAGSAYTANGMFLTVPVAQQVIGAATVGATRGLIQVAMDSTGAPISSFRVSKAVGVLAVAAAQISDISDNHPNGTFTLSFNPTGSLLSWNGGPPVAVVTGNKYRIFSEDMKEWIDVQLTGALPGVIASDNYTVVASAGDDTKLLVGYWFWDGATTLLLGVDRRSFGTTGFVNVSDTMKEQDLVPPHNDLRGSMVYSGGTVTALTGLNARIDGPIIVYIAGVRYAVAGSYAGVALTDNVTNYIHVTSAGLLTFTTTAPTGDVATIAEVVTAGATIVSVTDTRDPRLIVGQATRNAILDLSLTDRMRWDVANQRLHTERNGAPANTSVETGTVRVADNAVVATTGALTLDDANTVSPLALTSAIDPGPVNIPTLASQSVFANINSNYESVFGGFGILSGFGSGGDYVPAITNGPARIAEVDGGRLLDGSGVRVDHQNLTTITLPSGPNTSHVIYWNGGTWTSTQLSVGVTSSAGMPVAIARVDGTDALASIVDVRMFASGHPKSDALQVGGTLEVDSNFTDLASAILWLSCFAKPRRKRIVVNSDVAAGTLDMTDPSFGGISRLTGLVIEGAAAAAKPSVSWSTVGAMINANALTKDWTFRDLALSYTGVGAADNKNVCALLNPGHGLRCDNVTFDGGDALTHVANWTTVNTDFGGGRNSTTNRSTEFNGCVALNMFIADTLGVNAYFRTKPSVGTTVRGTLRVRGGDFSSATNTGHYFIDQQGLTGAGAQATFLVDDVAIRDIDAGIFRDGGTWNTSRRIVSNSKVVPTVGATVVANTTVGTVDLVKHIFDGQTQSLQGVRKANDCETFGATAIIGNADASATRCDFTVGGSTFTGSAGKMVDTDIDILSTGIVTMVSNIGRASLRSCRVTGAGVAMIRNLAGDFVVDSCSIASTAAGASKIFDIPFGTADDFAITNCDFSNANAANVPISMTGAHTGSLRVEGNRGTLLGVFANIAPSGAAMRYLSVSRNEVTCGSEFIHVTDSSGITFGDITDNTVSFSVGVTQLATVFDAGLLSYKGNKFNIGTSAPARVDIGHAATTELMATVSDNKMYNGGVTTATTTLDVAYVSSSVTGNNVYTQGDGTVGTRSFIVVSAGRSAMNGNVASAASLGTGSVGSTGTGIVVGGAISIADASALTNFTY